MKESELKFDRSCHILYSKRCREVILKSIAEHYPEEKKDAVFEAVQLKYCDYLKNLRKDLGGRKNFHNGVAGTYDCIALFAYYTVCRDRTSFKEIEDMNCELFLPAFRMLSFADCNKPIVKRLMYRAFVSSKKKCDRWGDYKMTVYPYAEGEPIRYDFTACPVAEFARENGLLDILPALCNADYRAMELIHARLIRKNTCGNGTVCDFAICGDKDEYAKSREEYVDSEGYRRNRGTIQ